MIYFFYKKAPHILYDAAKMLHCGYTILAFTSFFFGLCCPFLPKLPAGLGLSNNYFFRSVTGLLLFLAFLFFFACEV